MIIAKNIVSHYCIYNYCVIKDTIAAGRWAVLLNLTEAILLLLYLAAIIL